MLILITVQHIARKVLENTDHVLIVENGAQKFALNNGIQILPPGSLNVRESVTSQQSAEESLFESVPSYSDEGECYGNEWRDSIEDGKKKDCRPDCVVERSGEGGESFPYCMLSVDSEELGEPTVLQVWFVTFYTYLSKISLKSKYICKWVRTWTDVNALNEHCLVFKYLKKSIGK